MRPKPLAFAVLGLAAGAGIAQFAPPNFVHGFVALKENAEAKPLFIQPGNGGKTIALTVKNLQDGTEIRVNTDGGGIQSPYPPPMVLPFGTWPAVEGTTLTGLGYGAKMPVYITLAGDEKSHELSFVRVSDGMLIGKVPIIEGEAHGSHH